jgi:hypothetical protein
MPDRKKIKMLKAVAGLDWGTNCHKIEVLSIYFNILYEYENRRYRQKYRQSLAQLVVFNFPIVAIGFPQLPGREGDKRRV